MQTDIVKIIIADDHVLFIEGLKSLLALEKDIVILDVANDGKELLDILNYHEPDVILLDVSMPKLNGMDAIKHIKQFYPDIKVLVLSTYNEEHLIDRAKMFGANGYQIKNCNKEELFRAIHLVYTGQAVFPSGMVSDRAAFSEKNEFLKQFNLTKREWEVIGYIKRGYTNKKIADELYLSIYTVETHRKNIMQKLGINKPIALIKFIMENSL